MWVFNQYLCKKPFINTEVINDPCKFQILLANIVGIYGFQSGSKIINVFSKWDTIRNAAPVNIQMQNVLVKLERKANVYFAIIIFLTVVTTITDSVYVAYDSWSLLVLEWKQYIHQGKYANNCRDETK